MSRSHIKKKSISRSLVQLAPDVIIKAIKIGILIILKVKELSVKFSNKRHCGQSYRGLTKTLNISVITTSWIICQWKFQIIGVHCKITRPSQTNDKAGKKGAKCHSKRFFWLSWKQQLQQRTSTISNCTTIMSIPTPQKHIC